jgi:hypothetical protein
MQFFVRINPDKIFDFRQPLGQNTLMRILGSTPCQYLYICQHEEKLSLDVCSESDWIGGLGATARF